MKTNLENTLKIRKGTDRVTPSVNVNVKPGGTGTAGVS